MIRCCGELSECQGRLEEDSLASGNRKKLQSCGCCLRNDDSAAGTGLGWRSGSGRALRTAVRGTQWKSWGIPLEEEGSTEAESRS